MINSEGRGGVGGKYFPICSPLPVINGQFLKEPNKYDWIQKHLCENLHPIWVTTIKVDFT